ncbi:10252_t:CDS:10 [Paraglomus brasilianum]|uniref:10252_t:CDS:1 n=1 Tax=Paraglomus brasilianum TaxID=144538 RepID=A0A9N8ZCD2_9GLOM|nr:10252_t:CDS:10 [Paraglomus brasilianum]
MSGVYFKIKKHCYILRQPNKRTVIEKPTSEQILKILGDCVLKNSSHDPWKVFKKLMMQFLEESALKQLWRNQEIKAEFRGLVEDASKKGGIRIVFDKLCQNNPVALVAPSQVTSEQDASDEWDSNPMSGDDRGNRQEFGTMPEALLAEQNTVTQVAHPQVTSEHMDASDEWHSNPMSGDVRGNRHEFGTMPEVYLSAGQNTVAQACHQFTSEQNINIDGGDERLVSMDANGMRFYNYGGAFNEVVPDMVAQACHQFTSEQNNNTGDEWLVPMEDANDMGFYYNGDTFHEVGSSVPAEQNTDVDDEWQSAKLWLSRIKNLGLDLLAYISILDNIRNAENRL